MAHSNHYPQCSLTEAGRAAHASVQRCVVAQQADTHSTTGPAQPASRATFLAEADCARLHVAQADAPVTAAPVHKDYFVWLRIQLPQMLA